MPLGWRRKVLGEAGEDWRKSITFAPGCKEGLAGGAFRS